MITVWLGNSRQGLFPRPGPVSPRPPPLCQILVIFHLQLPLSPSSPSLGGPFSSPLSVSYHYQALSQKSMGQIPSNKSLRGGFPPRSCVLTGDQIILLRDNYSLSAWSPAGCWGRSPPEWVERGDFMEPLTSAHGVVHSYVLRKSLAFKYSKLPWWGT